MFSVGGTVGTGESLNWTLAYPFVLVNVPESRSRVAMGREIAELNARLQDMENKYNNLCYKSWLHMQLILANCWIPRIPRNHTGLPTLVNWLVMVSLLATLMATFKGDVKMDSLRIRYYVVPCNFKMVLLIDDKYET